MPTTDMYSTFVSVVSPTFTPVNVAAIEDFSAKLTPRLLPAQQKEQILGDKCAVTVCFPVYFRQ